MTAILDEFKKGWGIMLHPSQATSWPSVGGALGFYYKAAVIPFILFVVLWGTLSGFLLGFLGFFLGGLVGTAGLGTLLGVGGGYVLFLILGILSYFILGPIGLLVESGVMQGIGRGVKKFNNAYSATLSGNVWGTMPSIMLSWIPFVSLIGGIWAAVVDIIAISKVQNTSGKAAFGVWILTIIVFALIYLAVILAVTIGIAH
ncbi:MAG: hypothetical protein M1528_02315 [Candidatus Marsarchaeota archaeon]|nr:hypothetical protein [Candidatus Marsarchaeota archaeon]MCL5115343.1 hypothetical protein [Candidatus Marsarchaeota archaeon]